jgi:hypothetical protein
VQRARDRAGAQDIAHRVRPHIGAPVLAESAGVSIVAAGDARRIATNREAASTTEASPGCGSETRPRAAPEMRYRRPAAKVSTTKACATKMSTAKMSATKVGTAKVSTAHGHSATAEVTTAHGVPAAASAAATSTSATSSRRRVSRARQQGGQRDHGEDPDIRHGALERFPQVSNETASIGSRSYNPRPAAKVPPTRGPAQILQRIAGRFPGGARQLFSDS